MLATSHHDVDVTCVTMDWFKGKFTGLSPIYFMGKSMVSGVDFPLNQSIELIVQNILKPTRRKSKNVCISGESETSGGSVERLAVWLNGTLGLGRVRAQQVRHPTHPSLSQRCLESAREFEAHLQLRGAVTRGGSSGANR